MRRFTPARSLAVAVLCAGGLSVAACGSADEASGTTSAAVCTRGGPSGGAGRYFSETRHTVEGSFFDFWNKTGGLQGNGFPLSDVLNQKSTPEDPTLYASQCFERRVMEYHPVNDNAGSCDYTVQLALVGTDRFQGIYGGNPRGQAFHQSDSSRPFTVPLTVPGGQPAGTVVNARWFPETGHWVSGELLDAWQRGGGLDINGFPLSGEFMEPDPEHPEEGYLTQYFQRVVLQYKPRNSYPNNVEGQLVGKFHPRCNQHQPATDPVLPKMVVLHGQDASGGLTTGCAGVIVGKSTIMTAGHCLVESFVPGKALDHVVVEGFRPDGSSRGVIGASLEAVTRYPKAKNDSGWEYDLGLARLQGDLSKLYGDEWPVSCATKFIGPTQNVSRSGATQYGIIVNDGSLSGARPHSLGGTTLHDADDIGLGAGATPPFKYTAYFSDNNAVKGTEGDCGSPVVLGDGTIAGIYRGTDTGSINRETWVRLDARSDGADLGTWWRGVIANWGGCGF